MSHMNYNLILIQFLFTLLIFFLFWKIIKYILLRRQYKKFQNKPFPKEYKDILYGIHQYKMLSRRHKNKIHLLILIFIDKKEFIGANMTIDNEIKVIVAFYACLMRLGFDLGEKDKVITIIIYPEHFIVNDGYINGGIYHEEVSVLEGQSANGTVVISWKDIKYHLTKKDKDNVIIHEFAHELDFEDGVADGTPILENSSYKRWSTVCSKTFDTLRNQLEEGKHSMQLEYLGTYALTNEAEFFAVSSERFFEAPADFKKYFPDIYQEFKHFYKLDTKVLFNH